MAQSIESNIELLANTWLQNYNLEFKLKNSYFWTKENPHEIDKALNEYYSKNWWVWGNMPDAKLLLKDNKWNYFPILIEYKGYKDKLIKLDKDWIVENKTSKNEPNFKNINWYVNWAIHYANALLHHTAYTDIIAIWMTGYKDDFMKIQYEIEFIMFQKIIYRVGQRNLKI